MKSNVNTKWFMMRASYKTKILNFGVVYYEEKQI